jgi:hypothetical protein
MPKKQAEANKEVLRLQKEHYDAISAEQRALLDQAISNYIAAVDAITNGYEFEEAFPDVPEVAEYVPVDVCCEQRAAIECYISHTDRADTYISYVNRLHERNDFIHALAACPDFLVNLDIANKAIQDLMRGILSVGDVVEVLTDAAEQAALLGRIGSTKKTSARDLGISKLRAMAAGRREFREHTAWLNSSVTPLARQQNITEMMVRPQERISWALMQAQLIQNSLQNKNNALAQKAPHLMAELQLKLQKQIAVLQQQSSKALLVNTHVPNYAAVVFPKIDNATPQLLGNIGALVQNAASSWFLGPPDKQDGYRGTNEPSRNVTDSSGVVRSGPMG